MSGDKHKHKQDKQDKQDKLIDKYMIVRMIGKGAFGSVYLTYDKHKNYYASKVENQSDSSRLIDEYRIYEMINRRGMKEGIPQIYSLIKTPKFNIMIMQLLGPSLDSLFMKYNKKFNLQTVLALGLKILDLIENLHGTNFIHRDIKPSNFLIGANDDGDKLYLTDLGLSKQYIRNGKHIEYTTRKNLIGTLRYASVNVHMGIEPGRRDDLESVGYMLIYFLKGSLPWQGLKKKKHEDQVEVIGNVKLSISIDKLCEGLHDNFKRYLKLCRDLKFEEKPDYDKLRKCFTDIIDEMDISPDDLHYQWLDD